MAQVPASRLFLFVRWMGTAGGRAVYGTIVAGVLVTLAIYSVFGFRETLDMALPELQLFLLAVFLAVVAIRWADRFLPKDLRSKPWTAMSEADLSRIGWINRVAMVVALIVGTLSMLGFGSILASAAWGIARLLQ